MRAKKTHEQFVEEVKAVHGNKVNVVGTYMGALQRVSLSCNKGHEWESLPHVSLAGSACKLCADASRRKSTAQFAREVTAWNNDFKVVGKYKNDSTPILTECRRCRHVWKVIPNTLLKQKACPNCVSALRQNQPHKLTQEEFVRRVRAQNSHWLIKSQYERLRTCVNIECRTCGLSSIMIAENLMNKFRSCKRCQPHGNSRGYSDVSIAWLDYMSRKLRIVIEHAEHRGEYRIPGTRYKVDGYNKRSNTVFEFLGDYWHRLREPSAKKKTMQRLRQIKRMGYNVVYIWHSEYKQGMEPTTL